MRSSSFSARSWFASVLSRGGGEADRRVRSRSAKGVEEREGTRDDAKGSGDAPGGAEDGRPLRDPDNRGEDVASDEKGFVSLDCIQTRPSVAKPFSQGLVTHVIKVDRNSHRDEMFSANFGPSPVERFQRW